MNIEIDLEFPTVCHGCLLLEDPPRCQLYWRMAGDPVHIDIYTESIGKESNTTIPTYRRPNECRCNDGPHLPMTLIYSLVLMVLNAKSIREFPQEVQDELEEDQKEVLDYAVSVLNRWLHICGIGEIE